MSYQSERRSQGERYESMVVVHPKLLPTEFLKVEVSTETGGNDIEHHLQLKALRGDRIESTSVTAVRSGSPLFPLGSSGCNREHGTLNSGHRLRERLRHGSRRAQASDRHADRKRQGAGAVRCILMLRWLTAYENEAPASHETYQKPDEALRGSTPPQHADAPQGNEEGHRPYWPGGSQAQPRQASRRRGAGSSRSAIDR